MTVFQVYQICREHGEDSSKFGGVKGASVNVSGSMGGDSLENGKGGVLGGGTP